MKRNLLLLITAFALTAAVLADSESAALQGLMNYQSGADPAPLRRYDELVAKAAGDSALRNTLEADFIRVLTGESTFEARRFACQWLAVVGGQASVPALAGLLKNDDTVGIACAALVQNPSAKAGDALRQALSTVQGRALEQVVFGLGIRSDAKAAGQLVKLTRAADAGVAGAACVALGKIGTAPAQKALAALRQETPPALVRPVAEGSFLLAEGLAAKGNRQAAMAIYHETLAARWPLDVRRGSLAALIRLEGASAEKLMLEVLAGNDDPLKPVAIAALPELKSPGASKAFAAVLPKLEPGYQLLLVQALVPRGDADAIQAITQFLGMLYDLERTGTGLMTDVGVVGPGTIAALGQMGDASTVPVLARAALATKSASELKAIELALANLKGGDAVDQALAAQLRNRMAGPKTVFLAALVRRANPVSTRVFLAETASTDPAMVKLAFQGLSRTANAEELPSVLKALGDIRAAAALDDAQASVGQLIRRVGDPAASAKAVRRAYEAAPGAAVAKAFLPLLAFFPDADSLKLVAEAAGSADAEVRDLGLRTLADWPEVSAWEPLMAQYSKASSETDRVLALRGLARLLGEQNAHPDAQLVARYRELLAGAKSDNDRKLILGALAGCNDPAALALAVEQLANAGVRSEAALAVRKIAEAVKAQHPQAAADALKQLQ